MEKMSDPIERQAAIDAFDKQIWGCLNIPVCKEIRNAAKDTIRALPEIVRCKDCKYYSPMNKETKTGICDLTMHQNFGDNWFCAGAERR